MNLRPLLEQLRAEQNLPGLAAFVTSRDSILAADGTGARLADKPAASGARGRCPPLP